MDIYIEPGLKDYSPAAFKQWKEIIDIGNRSGEEFYDTFKHLADSLSVIEPLKSVAPIPDKDEYLITDISIIGNKKISSKIIEGN